MIGWRSRIGICIPANNNVLEPEAYRHLPEGVSIHVSRMMVPADYDAHGIRRMEEQSSRAAEELSQAKVDRIAYACMATSLALGREWDLRYEARGGSQRRVTAGQALVRALNALEARNVAVLTPYPDTISPLINEYFRDNGLTVVAEAHHPIPDVTAVGDVQPATVYRWGREFLPPKSADAICVLATDLRTFEVLEALERDKGLPVVSSNLALLWDLLGSALPEGLTMAGNLALGRTVRPGPKEMIEAVDEDATDGDSTAVSGAR